ncbi:MAG: hypothetical protein QNJ98_09220 [Planctomycetota bacterium]|nr:hypothetical protein [Planctomycetota bacterium]
MRRIALAFAFATFLGATEASACTTPGASAVAPTQLQPEAELLVVPETPADDGAWIVEPARPLSGRTPGAQPA